MTNSIGNFTPQRSLRQSSNSTLSTVETISQVMEAGVIIRKCETKRTQSFSPAQLREV
jgi:hypothetical protein